jgi:hypothetical protein
VIPVVTAAYVIPDADQVVEAEATNASVPMCTGVVE